MKAPSFLRHAGGVALAVTLAALLGACEKSQESSRVNTAKKLDTKAWEGGSDAAFRANGWKPGDQESWEAELRKRNQAQNEYARVR